MQHISYTCGFLFNNEGSTVMLLRKSSGPFKGRLNGVGGKLEINEYPIICMEREFKEETGLEGFNWIKFLCLTNYNKDNPWSVHFFKAFADKGVFLQNLNNSEIHTVEPREIQLVKDICFRSDIVKNLKWIIPMALDNDLAPAFIEEKIK